MAPPSCPLPVRRSSYTDLPEALYARVSPTPPPRPGLLAINRELARDVGLDPDALAGEEGVAALAGGRLPDGADPLALAYAGHQFGAFVPTLGDGRAVLLGERTAASSGSQLDIQLKGAGKTPFARRGDGRSPLGPVVKEYLAGEAMAALGIPTTRALAMVETGEPVYRPRPEPGAVLARTAASHLRIGTFEYAARVGEGAVRALADYALARHAPERIETPNPYRALLDHVCERTADLVAQWMLVGFVHGVMNTDNISVAGETIDYGPFAFMNRYDPRAVFSSIDTGGRYAFGQQPRIAQWNLARLAEALLPLLGAREEDAVSAAETALQGYASRFERRYESGLRRKLGLEIERDGDPDLARDLLGVMAEGGADYTLAFRRLCELSAEPDDRDGPFLDLFGPEVREPPEGAGAQAPGLRDGVSAARAGANRAPDRHAPASDESGGARTIEAWLAAYRARLRAEERGDGARRASMQAVNPAYILRHHLAERAASAAAQGDLAPLFELSHVLSRPYDDQPERADYAHPPPPEEAKILTFCGT